jgi:WD40 repeat protein
MATSRRNRPAPKLTRPTTNNKRIFDGMINDSYGYTKLPVNQIDEKRPLAEVGTVGDHGAILAISFSPDGALLATLSTMGQVKLWRVPEKEIDGNWYHVATFRDPSEQAIEEYYCCEWLEGEGEVYLVVAGKRKDRHRWSDADDDNHVLPGIVKIFNLQGEVVHRLEGHEEEILYLKIVRYENENFLLSCSQDGYIMSWNFSNDWREMRRCNRLTDGESCMVFSIEPLPGSGNRILLAACDDKLRVFDLQSQKLLQSFSSGYTAYCDHALFIDPRALDPILFPRKESDWFVVARGVELLDSETLTPMAVNSVKIFKLSLEKGKFSLQEILSLKDPSYNANSWLMKLAVSGSSLFVPTVTGELFCIDLNLALLPECKLSDCMTAHIRHHDPLEVRQALLHPDLPLLLTCADDGMVKIYRQ